MSWKFYDDDVVRGTIKRKIHLICVHRNPIAMLTNMSSFHILGRMKMTYLPKHNLVSR